MFQEESLEVFRLAESTLTKLVESAKALIVPSGGDMIVPFPLRASSPASTSGKLSLLGHTLAESKRSKNGA